MWGGSKKRKMKEKKNEDKKKRAKKSLIRKGRMKEKEKILDVGWIEKEKNERKKK